MNGPLVTLDRVAGFFAGGEVHARNKEFFAARHLEIEPDGLAVVTPKFVAGDFVRDSPFMYEAESGTIGSNVPDAVHEVPRAFVAEHEQSRISGRELNMAEPAFVTVNEIGATRGYIDREKLLGTFCFVDFVEPGGFRSAGINGGTAFDESAGQESRVGVEGRNGPTKRKVSDFACFAFVERGGVNCAGTGVEALTEFSIDDFASTAGFCGDWGDGVGAPVEGAQLAGATFAEDGKDHFVPVGGERVLVEVEAFAAVGQMGKAEDAVAGVGVDP